MVAIALNCLLTNPVQFPFGFHYDLEFHLALSLSSYQSMKLNSVCNFGLTLKFWIWIVINVLHSLYILSQVKLILAKYWLYLTNWFILLLFCISEGIIFINVFSHNESIHSQGTTNSFVCSTSHTQIDSYA